MEKAIRVLVANRPRLMREVILATFKEQPDIEIVGEVADDAEIVGRVAATLPHFLFIALDEPGKRPRICDTVLRQHPEVRIIALAPERNYSVHYWVSMDIHSNKIESSEQGILGAMRGVTEGAGNTQ